MALKYARFICLLKAEFSENTTLEISLLGTNNYKKDNNIEMRLVERNQDNNSYHVNWK